MKTSSIFESVSHTHDVSIVCDKLLYRNPVYAEKETIITIKLYDVYLCSNSINLHDTIRNNMSRNL